MKKHILSVVVSLAISSVASAELKLASVFTDNMVLQRYMTVPVWGTADAGKKVTVSIGGGKAEATADEKGNFMVKLPSMDAHIGQDFVASEDGGNTVKLSNVAIGDVWICSGQSNMEWPLKKAQDADKVLQNSNDVDLRLLLVAGHVATEPVKSIRGKWQVSSPESAAPFSAVGWFFGEELRDTQKVPIGLVGTYWGGTPAEAWTPVEALVNDPELKPMYEKYRRAVQKFEMDKDAAASANAPAKPGAKKPVDPRKDPHQPAVLYNGMVAPLVPMAFRGVIWYQGESNTMRAEQYADLFPTMINSWRNAWGEGAFPFFFVQLANYGSHQDTEKGSPWAELREAQRETVQKVPNTGMAVIIDVGSATTIHPLDKKTVGRRLAMLARKLVYGEKDLVAVGPTFESMKVDGNRAILTFSGAQSLMAKGDLSGFTISGSDQHFVPAKAQIEGNTVVVSSPDVSQPAAVRYAWAENPKANLYNEAGLPASPFRTDNWALVTAGRK